MNALRRDAEKSPVYHVLILWLFAVGFSALPLKKFFGLFVEDQITARLLAEITVRALLTAAAIYLMVKYKFSSLFGFSGKALLFVLPAFIVAVNNFPIIAFITGDAVFLKNGLYTALFIVDCLCIGAFEEVVFRGLIFPLIYLKLKSKKYKAFWASAVSSAVFACSHLINLFGGAGIGETFLQVGYSFLIGGMCAVTVLITGEIITAILLHFIYDVGGFVLSAEYGVASGYQWNTLTIVITAVLGVIVATYMIFIALKNDGKKLENSLYKNYSSETSDEVELN